MSELHKRYYADAAELSAPTVLQTPPNPHKGRSCGALARLADNPYKVTIDTGQRHSEQSFASVQDTLIHVNGIISAINLAGGDVKIKISKT